MKNNKSARQESSCRSRQPTVLVGGGTPVAHAAYCELLAEAGFQPASAATLGLAKELACAAAVRPDSAVVDLSERDTAGVKQVSHIKELLPDLPLVILSGGVSRGPFEPLTRFPLVEVLSKPVDFEALRVCLLRAPRTQGGLAKTG